MKLQKQSFAGDVLSGTGRLTLYYLALALGNGLFFPHEAKRLSS